VITTPGDASRDGGRREVSAVEAQQSPAIAALAALGFSILAAAGCGGGSVDKRSDAYSDGGACGRIYLQTYNEKTLERTPMSEAVALCEYNHNLYRTPGGSGNNASYVAGVKDAYRQASQGG
jgi:hypothetical protein